jgi:pimeloyl-ACP methyl ester carboxylesterase
LQERAQWQSYLFQGSPDWLTAPSVKAQAALQVSVWKSTKLLEYLPRVKIPVLVVSGADDVVFPSANATELATRLHHASLDILPGAGYDAMAEDEPAFVAAVERFTG